MTYFRKFLNLQNTYYVIRAAESFVHRNELLSAQWELNLPKLSLTPEGRTRAKEVYLAAKELAWLNENANIITSTIPRAEQTALIGAEVLGVRFEGKFLRTMLLNARNFGRLDGKPAERYGEILGIDSAALTNLERTARYKELQVEDVESVAERILLLFEHLEGRSGQIYVLNTHSSLISVLWAMIKNIPLSEHGQQEQFVPAEMRRLGK